MEDQVGTEEEEFFSDIGDSGEDSDSEDEELIEEEGSESDSGVESEEECEDSEDEDILDFDCLTDNASDGSVSSDDDE